MMSCCSLKPRGQSKLPYIAVVRYLDTATKLVTTLAKCSVDPRPVAVWSFSCSWIGFVAFGGKHSRKEESFSPLHACGHAVRVNLMLFMLLLKCPGPGLGLFQPCSRVLLTCLSILSLRLFPDFLALHDARVYGLFLSRPTNQIQRTLFPLTAEWYQNPGSGCVPCDWGVAVTMPICG